MPEFYCASSQQSADVFTDFMPNAAVPAIVRSPDGRRHEE